jgi:microcystin-dependent protein
MSDPYLSEIRIVSFGFAPKGWALCNGQVLPIAQNQVLFSLIGTTYGGDGITTFALPDLRGRVPIHNGNGHVRGEAAGELAHTLVIGELPAHVHSVMASSLDGDLPSPANTLLAGTATAQLYSTAASNLTALNSSTVTSSGGGSQPHENTQPFLVLSFCIALQGVVPSAT